MIVTFLSDSGTTPCLAVWWAPWLACAPSCHSSTAPSRCTATPTSPATTLSPPSAPPPPSCCKARLSTAVWAAPPPPPPATTWQPPSTTPRLPDRPWWCLRRTAHGTPVPQGEGKWMTGSGCFHLHAWSFEPTSLLVNFVLSMGGGGGGGGALHCCGSILWPCCCQMNFPKGTVRLCLLYIVLPEVLCRLGLFIETSPPSLLVMKLKGNLGEGGYGDHFVCLTWLCLDLFCMMLPIFTKSSVGCSYLFPHSHPVVQSNRGRRWSLCGG